MADSPGLFTISDIYWDTVIPVTSDFTTDGTTNQQTITELTFAALENSKYEVEATLVGQCTSTIGTAFAISFSAAGGTGTFLVYGSTATSTTTVAGNVIGTPETISFWTAASTDESLIIKSIVVIAANSGNITTDIKKTTSGTATVKTGSRMKIKKLI